MISLNIGTFPVLEASLKTGPGNETITISRTNKLDLEAGHKATLPWTLQPCPTSDKGKIFVIMSLNEFL